MICFGILLMVCDLNAAQAPPVPDNFCQISKPIRWSAQDTRQTKEQVDIHNRQWKALCAKLPPKR